MCACLGQGRKGEGGRRTTIPKRELMFRVVAVAVIALGLFFLVLVIFYILGAEASTSLTPCSARTIVKLTRGTRSYQPRVRSGF